MDFGSRKGIGVASSSTTMSNNTLHIYSLAEIVEPLLTLREDKHLRTLPMADGLGALSTANTITRL